MVTYCTTLAPEPCPKVLDAKLTSISSAAVLSMLSVPVPSSNRRRASIAGEDTGVRRCDARTLVFQYAPLPQPPQPAYAARTRSRSALCLTTAPAPAGRYARVRSGGSRNSYALPTRRRSASAS